MDSDEGAFVMSEFADSKSQPQK